MSTEQLVLQGTLKGHNGWVTAIATNTDFPDLVISASRDKSIIVWKIARDQTTGAYGYAQRRLVGHNHFIQDLALTSDSKNALYALSGSWDGSLRLWDVQTGASKLRFTGHTKDVLSVAFSSDNRQIVSGSRDNTIKVWNTLGKCKFTMTKDGHKEWVSCVRFSPNVEVPTLVSAGWDKVVKVWNMSDLTLKFNLVGHSGYVNTVIVSPDGTLCASGGKDGNAMLWDINEGKHLYSLEASEVINTLVFSPIRFWLCAATASSIIIWDIEAKVCLDTVKLPAGETVTGKKTLPTQCTSLCWSQDGNVLYAGYSDNVIRAYQVSTISE